jgi:hypothetical protein
VFTDQYGQTLPSSEIKPGAPVQVGAELKRGIYIMKVLQGREVMMHRMVKK